MQIVYKYEITALTARNKNGLMLLMLLTNVTSLPPLFLGP